MIVIKSDIKSENIISKAAEISAVTSNPFVAGMSLVTGFTVGESTEYLSSFPLLETVDKLDYGQSIAIFSRTGSGKTTAMLSVISALVKHETMEMGGWSTPDVYKNVYQETFDSERRKADSIIDEYWNKVIEQES